MKKRRNKKYVPKPQCWRSIQLAIASASTETQSNDVHRWLATEAYASLEKLSSGLFTLNDFISVSKLNAFAYMLAMEIYPALDNESRQTVMAQKAAIELAADALASIGARRERTGKFGASGPELSTIRKSFSLLDALTGYANRGETVRAMMKADTMTREALGVSATTATRKPHDKVGSPLHAPSLRDSSVVERPGNEGGRIHSGHA